MEQFVDRIIKAMKLDANLYKEVKDDEEALGQALIIVTLSSLAGGIGSSSPKTGILIIGIVLALISWLVWAYLTYWIGTKLLPEPQTHANPKELLRVLGFASAPGMIRILGIFPNLRIMFFIIAAIWMMAAMVVAIRQALDYTSIGRAVVVCFIAWLIQVIIFALIFTLMGYPGKA